MSLTLRNSRDLITPDNIKLKILVYGLPGVGKTEFLRSVPGIHIAACETGQGKGLLTIASAGVPYVEPENLAEIEKVCSGSVFPNASALGIDSLSAMAGTFIKDAALKLPRMKGDSDKRKIGVPELDDYGTMGEMTRKLIARAIALPGHLIVTATERYKGPDPETGQGESMIGPDLPGALMAGSSAMFDFVFRLRTRPKLRDPKDAKSRYIERYFVTQPDGLGTIAKCRSSLNGKALLDKEEVFDPESGAGTFPFLLDKILKGYEKLQKV